MSRSPVLPRLYAIVDAACFATSPKPAAAMAEFTAELLAAGVTLVQLRNKSRDAASILEQARLLGPLTRGKARLILNDRADLCLAAAADGVHLGQQDLSPQAARHLLGETRWVGFSTHSPEQVREADSLPVDYIAVGPVFATSSKADPDPVIGLAGVRTARAATSKPLVAIGGITRANCREVLQAGADAVAVISDLLGSPRKSAEAFLERLG